MVSLWDIASGYFKISMLSFGGGLGAWAHQVIVDERKWLDDDQFLSAMGLSRILPGPNQINLAVYVGTTLRGLAGAVAALAGLIIVPFLVVLGLGICYFQYQHIWQVEAALRGMAIVAVGMTVGMGLKMTLRYSFAVWSALIFGVTFLTIAILRWQLLPVVAVLIPVSVGLSWLSTGKGRAKSGDGNDQ